MHAKSLILGILIGAAAAVALMFIFGDQILGGVGDATEQVGKTVQEAGKALEDQSDKLK
ncbi:hypothetical protein ACFL6C_00260 [Myxococcota bacterium]